MMTEEQVRKSFWDKIAMIPEHTCWEWTASRKPKVNDHNDYGNFYDGKKVIGAHRYSWMIHNQNRPVPKGLYVIHSCDNPGCVNPNHLRLGTPLDNVRDKIEHKRGSLRGTHCKAGHKFTRTFIRKNGQESQQCYVCRNLAQKRHYLKKYGGR